jgi:anti-anti-sigma factor
MQVTRRVTGKVVELKIEGRLDGYWADHLAAVVDQEIRQGAHHIQTDLSEVAFLSSAGIGVLVRFYKDLTSIRGSFAVSNCSRNVLKVLELSKLKDLLVAKEALLVETGSQGSAGEAETPKPVEHIECPEALYEIYVLGPEAKLECSIIGDPSLIERCGFTEAHCRSMEFSDSSFAIGLGALGEHFQDCKGRFGEFIAAGATVAYLPTDGTNVPDFLVGGGPSLPEIQVCYAIACHGSKSQPFRSLVRFETKNDGQPIALSRLLHTCLDASDTQQAGVVIIAESAGLVGASLRRSPVNGASTADPFAFPQIRDWLSFTAEPAYSKSVALIAGIAIKGSSGALASMVRPLASASNAPLSGHFHAATFAYRPVQKGEIHLKSSIRALFERQTLEGVLHLLSDSRRIAGGGESELVRGACWVAPISNFALSEVQA